MENKKVVLKFLGDQEYEFPNDLLEISIASFKDMMTWKYGAALDHRAVINGVKIYDENMDNKIRDYLLDANGNLKGKGQYRGRIGILSHVYPDLIKNEINTWNFKIGLNLVYLLWNIMMRFRRTLIGEIMSFVDCKTMRGIAKVGNKKLQQ